MAPHVRAAEADRIVPALGAQDSPPPTGAAPDARAKQPAEVDVPGSLSQRIKAVQDRLALLPDTGERTDKAFFDALSGLD